MNIAELAHMEDQEDQDQDTVKAKVASAAHGGVGGTKGGDKRTSLENPRKSLEKSVTLTRQATDANRYISCVLGLLLPPASSFLMCPQRPPLVVFWAF